MILESFSATAWLMEGKLLPLLRNLFYTALGAALFYSTWGRKKLKVYFLSDMIDVLHLSPDTQVITEFLIFIFIGCAISIGVVQPQTAPQAFSAGLGWTGLVGRTR